MAKTKPSETTRTQTESVPVTQKFGRFDPKVWEKFEEWLSSRGMRTQTFIDRLVDDALAGHFIHLHQLRPEAVLELDRSAEEMGIAVDLLVGRIVSDWTAARMQERKKSGSRAASGK